MIILKPLIMTFLILPLITSINYLNLYYPKEITLAKDNYNVPAMAGCVMVRLNKLLLAWTGSSTGAIKLNSFDQTLIKSIPDDLTYPVTSETSLVAISDNLFGAAVFSNMKIEMLEFDYTKLPSLADTLIDYGSKPPTNTNLYANDVRIIKLKTTDQLFLITWYNMQGYLEGNILPQTILTNGQANDIPNGVDFILINSNSISGCKYTHASYPIEGGYFIIVSKLDGCPNATGIKFKLAVFYLQTPKTTGNKAPVSIKLNYQLCDFYPPTKTCETNTKAVDVIQLENTTKDIVVAWDSSENGDYDIFFTILDSSTFKQKTTTIYKANPDKISGSQFNPFLGLIGTDKFVVGYISNDKITLQAFDYNLATVENEITVSTNPNVSAPNIYSYFTNRIMIVWTQKKGDYSYDIVGNILDLTTCGTFTSSRAVPISHIDFSFLSTQTVTITDISTISTSSHLSCNGTKIDTSKLPEQCTSDALTIYSNSSYNEIFSYTAKDGEANCKLTLFPCYMSCFSCMITGDETDNKCTKCLTDSNYYTFTPKQTQCILKTIILDGYYPDDVTKSWLSCYSSCLSCSAAGTSTAHFCTICAQDYYPLVDNSSMCYKSLDTVLGYIYNPTKYIFEHIRCLPNCSKCTRIGDTTNHCCTVCADNYYPLIDNNSNCYLSTAVIDHYVYNSVNRIFQRCYSSCLTCKTLGTSTDNQCSQCDKSGGFYPLEDNYSQCFSSALIPSGYFLDQDALIFRKCYSTCKTCSVLGNAQNPNCIECLDGVDCSPCIKIYYNNACIDNCPQGLIYDILYSTCIDCSLKNQLLYNNSCVNMCPIGYSNVNSICKSCSEQGLIAYKEQCVQSCPAGNTLIAGVCQDNLQSSILSSSSNTVSNTITMINPNPTCDNIVCQNDGKCTLAMNKPVCECGILYTGQFCQIRNDSDTINKFISI
jgi:hypothetical protein